MCTGKRSFWGSGLCVICNTNCGHCAKITTQPTAVPGNLVFTHYSNIGLYFDLTASDSGFASVLLPVLIHCDHFIAGKKDPLPVSTNKTVGGCSPLSCLYSLYTWTWMWHKGGGQNGWMAMQTKHVTSTPEIWFASWLLPTVIVVLFQPWPQNFSNLNQVVATVWTWPDLNHIVAV